MPSDGSIFDKYQSIHSRIFFQSLIIELFGVLCFQFVGGTVTNKLLAPFVNGFALCVLVFLAANISGGHLNPAVTFSTFICGFYPAMHSALYIVIQIVGAVFGALISAGLTNNPLGGGDGSPGCFDRSGINPDLSDAQIFGWEAMMTFVLIGAVYSCGIAKPGHGSFTPLVVGLALLACAGTGGSQTGAALNPARVLGPAIVFSCGWDVSWLYILGEFFAAVMACLLFVTVSGWGPLAPLKNVKVLGLSMREAVIMWATGSPPKRLRENAGDDVNDLIARHDRDVERGKAEQAENAVKAA